MMAPNIPGFFWRWVHGKKVKEAIQAEDEEQKAKQNPCNQNYFFAESPLSSRPGIAVSADRYRRERQIG